MIFLTPLHSPFPTNDEALIDLYDKGLNATEHLYLLSHFFTILYRRLGKRTF